MTLDEIYKSYVQDASRLGDFENMSKLDLANGYCDAEERGDEYTKSAFWAALNVRYFYKIYGWMRTSASCKLQPEDFAGWLHNALYVAFYYRYWRWEYKAICREGKFVQWELDENGNKIPNPYYWKNDPASADRSINYFCSAQRGREYQALNKDKRKADVLNSSLDYFMEVAGDAALQESGAVTLMDSSDSIRGLVHAFLEQGREVESIILDGIAYQDTFKEIKTKREDIKEDDEEDIVEDVWNVKDEEVINESSIEKFQEKIEEEIEEDIVEPTLPFKPARYSYSYSFDKRKLIKHLKSLDNEFLVYFSSFYEVPEEECEKIFAKVKSLSSGKLYKYIDKTLANIKNDPKMLSFLI